MVNENWYLEVRGKDEVEGWFVGMMKEHMPVYSILDNNGKQEYGVCAVTLPRVEGHS